MKRRHKYYTPIDRGFQGGSNDKSCVARKSKFGMSAMFIIFNNSFLVITISRDGKGRGRIHLSIENTKAVLMVWDLMCRTQK